jgi:F-type H+-transporting ATPase subunit a
MEIIIQVMEMAFNKIFIGWGVPALFSFYFDIFDGLLQAFVFTFLTTLYIEESLE